MKFTLQVSSRTESFNKEPVYHLRVQMRSFGSTCAMSDLFTIQVTKQDFDNMPPGHVFVADITTFPRPNL